VITGKALYTGALDLAEAIARTKEEGKRVNRVELPGDMNPAGS